MTKITSILFPVDFSSVSYHTVDFLLDITKRTGAFVTIFHADVIPAMADLGTRPLLVENQQNIINEQFKELEARFPELKAIPHRLDSSPGSLQRGIEYFLESKNERIDLIIMGTSGARGLKEVFAGTHAMHVIERSTVPVLVVPEKAPFQPLKKVAFAYDYAEITNPGNLDALKALTSAYNAHISVLNISHDLKGSVKDNFASEEAISKEFPEATYVNRKGEDVEKEIENYVMLNAIDLVTVIQREHNFFEKLFTETTTEKLAYHSQVPLLVLRA